MNQYSHQRVGAGVVDFLSGPNSTYMTGQILNVDGGIVNS
jgi:NAD(P)-dependent dehydrogenase (short-subunit alcohol dehydrogenase family)